jgi:preprotein translocase subunit SecA
VRDDQNDLIYRTKREKYFALIEEIKRETEKGRAILVGTTSVEVSELLSKMLSRDKVKHNVLNAKQHQREAEIVAEAGQPQAVTIATNMAGRGTDIKLHPKVKDAGGLAIIGTERHEARRIDRQLRGRAGRQGDPGSSKFFLSLEDDLMRLFGGERIAGVMQFLKVPEGEPIEHNQVTKSVERAQKKVEENNFGIRKRLLEYDNVMNQQREVVYDRRRHALLGERLRGEIFEFVEEFIGDLYDDCHETADVEHFREELRTTLLIDLEITEDEFKSLRRENCVEQVMEIAEEFYSRKEQMFGSEFMADVERIAILQTIDEKWREHLRVMDDLKEGIHLRAYGQKDPLLEYKGEAYKVFVELIKEMNRESANFAFRYFPEMEAQQQRNVSLSAPPGASALPRFTSVSTGAMRFSRPSAEQFTYANAEALTEAAEAVSANVANGAQNAASKAQPIVNTAPKIGRNDPCPFDSNKKFKNCCGASGHKACTRQ